MEKSFITKSDEADDEDDDDGEDGFATISARAASIGGENQVNSAAEQES